ncbi:MAG: ThuA domain-containing protein [Balneolaceae bacterium]
MTRFFTFSLLVSLIFTINACGQDNNPLHQIYLVEDASHSVLVFSKTMGWRHDSIEAGAETIIRLGEQNGFSVTWSEDAEYFTDSNLSNYDAIIFLNTTLTILNSDEQRSAFQRFIQNGGGFVGVHSATDTEYDWPWYGELVGAYFDNHPGNPNVREAIIDVVDSDHPSTMHLPERWQRTDEWYNFGMISDQIHVIMKLDTDSYEGSDHPGNHPVAWYQEYDGGRSFYTASGHTIESFSEPLFIEHLLGGLNYVMGIE